MWGCHRDLSLFSLQNCSINYVLCVNLMRRLEAGLLYIPGEPSQHLTGTGPGECG